MPQIEFADYVPQLVWLVITFVAFYWVMSSVALPRIAAALEQRQRRIGDDLEAAGRLSEEAAAARTAFDATMAAARGQAQAIATTMRDEIAAEAAKRQAELGAELDARATREEARIAKATAEVRASLREVAIAAVRTPRMSARMIAASTASTVATARSRRASWL